MLMNARCHLARHSAFSLVEMVLALGIFAFCILVIFGLLGSVMNSSKESWMETRSAHIARQIADDLTPDPDTMTGTARATVDQGILLTPNVVQVPLFPTTASTNSATYSAEGLPVAASASDAVFKADIKIMLITNEAAAGVIPARKVSQLQIDIRPITQPTAAPFRFVSRITPQNATP